MKSILLHVYEDSGLESRMQRQAGIGANVVDHHGLSGGDRLGAEHRRARRLAHRVSHPRLHPPARLVHEGDAGVRRVGDHRGHGHEVVEVGLGLRVDDRARPQRFEAIRLALQTGGRRHCSITDDVGPAARLPGAASSTSRTFLAS